MPRTATVKAETPVRAYALDRDAFLSTVTSHVPSHRAAESIVASRLTGLSGARARPVQAGV